MSITIRDFRESDLEFVQQKDYLLWLELQYDGDYARDNAYSAVDEADNLLGVACLSYQASWFAESDDVLHKLKYDIVTDDTSEASSLIKGKLMDRLIDRLKEFKSEYPERKMCICSWLDNDSTYEMQFLLEKGYLMCEVVPVLKYDLTKEIKHYPLPEGIVIKQLPIDEATVNQYIDATYYSNDSYADSKAELWFRSGGPGFCLYAATDQDKIIGAITLWDIDEDRSATENIFTLPEYRRKNIARELIATGFNQLKNSGKKIATLSLLGTNGSAMKLYISAGYELMYHLIELRYYV